MSKFFDLKKNKGKVRNKPVVESEVELSTADPELLAAEEVDTLIQSLNEDTRTKEVEAVVAKAIDVVVKEKEAETSNQGKMFQAYGLCYNQKNKKWVKISIDYNPETGYSKFVSAEPYADSAPTALNKLNKILSLRMMRKEEVY